ncbi:MAG: DUF6252 family protein [Bacteroidota bacterium]|nr:DUF6252 family protein [Bacteroidota bacterium]
MKTFKTILLMPLFFLLLGSQCNKDLKTTLPPVTQGGSETFGCFVDGQLFRNGPSSFCITSLVAELDSNKTFIINTRNGIGDKLKFVGFKITNWAGVAKYNLCGNNRGEYSELNGNNFCKFLTDSLDQTGIVNITYFDSIREIVSGTFTFKAKLYQSALGTCDSTRIIDVTEGRFDLYYSKYR